MKRYPWSEPWDIVICNRATRDESREVVYRIQFDNSHGDDIHASDEQHANGALMQAAPNLYKRLEAIINEADINPSMTLGDYFGSISGEFVRKVMKDANSNFGL